MTLPERYLISATDDPGETGAPPPVVRPRRIAALGGRWVWLVSLAVSVGALIVLLTQVEIARVGALLGGSEPILLTAAFVAFLLDALFRAVRLTVLVPNARDHSVAGYLRVVALQGVYAMVIPARLGEVAYMVLLNRMLGLRPGAAVANVVYQRICDLLVGMVLFGVVVVVVADWDLLTPYVVGLLLAGFVAVIVLWMRIERTLDVLGRLTHRWPGRRWRLGRAMLRSVLQARRWSALTTEPGRRARVLLHTVMQWIFSVLAVAFLLLAFRVDMSVAELLFVGVGFQFVAAIPVYAIGGFGIAEAGLAGLLLLLGYATGEAASLGIAVRFLIFAAPFAVFGMLSPAFLSDRQAAIGKRRWAPAWPLRKPRLTEAKVAAQRRRPLPMRRY